LNQRRSCVVAGKLAEDDKQKTKVQRLLIAMGAQPSDILSAVEEPQEGAGTAAGAAPNGLPEEAAAQLPPTDADGDMDVDEGVNWHLTLGKHCALIAFFLPTAVICFSGCDAAVWSGQSCKLPAAMCQEACASHMMAVIMVQSGYTAAQLGGSRQQDHGHVGGAGAARPPAEAGELAADDAAAPSGRDAEPAGRERGIRKQSAESDEDDRQREKGRSRDRGRDAKEREPTGRDREKERGRGGGDRWEL